MTDDQDVRLECLRLASLLAHDSADLMKRANEIYAWVSGPKVTPESGQHDEKKAAADTSCSVSVTNCMSRETAVNQGREIQRGMQQAMSRRSRDT
jgi:hypothetical protein